MKKAMIAMSGGVDSSVAAYLAMQSGYDCVGVTMRLFDNGDAGISPGRTCCSLSDVEDARSVAFRLGMRYYVFNFTEDFRQKVIAKFISSYLAGRTPNPCIACNRYMKFDKLLQRARVLGYDYLATGHYARIERDQTGFCLKKAVDETKDQSYVLYNLTQEQLSHLLLPLGGLRKTETRHIAESQGFINAQKRDSQDICFVPDGDYAKAIERLCGKTFPPGDFVDSRGNYLGRHNGIIRYTVGQRRGLGLAMGEPVYVLRVCAENNTVILGSDSELWSRELCAGDFNWISGKAPGDSFRCKAKIRYHQPEQPALVTPAGDGLVRIVFDAPQRAITPGQSAVLYDGDTVLGGGIIL